MRHRPCAWPAALVMACALCACETPDTTDNLPVDPALPYVHSSQHVAPTQPWRGTFHNTLMGIDVDISNEGVFFGHANYCQCHGETRPEQDRLDIHMITSDGRCRMPGQGVRIARFRPLARDNKGRIVRFAAQVEAPLWIADGEAMFERRSPRL